MKLIFDNTPSELKTVVLYLIIDVGIVSCTMFPARAFLSIVYHFSCAL